MIILINGSINSGKSTVAKALTERIGDCACIEVDSLREFIRHMDHKQALPFNLKNAISVAGNFLTEGLDVVIPYPLTAENTEAIVSALKRFNQPVYYFSLSPPLEVALSDRGGRKLSDQEKKRIKYHYQKGINDPGLGLKIDNSKQAPEETVAQILAQLNSDSEALIHDGNNKFNHT